MTKKDYMLRAIELARKGEGKTNPNPLVGAVIVKDGRIIGEGYHAMYGHLHAERNAIASLKESAKGATLYVTLEPCCHYGKTPPCTDAVLKNRIARVVIGSRDPNPKAAGKGAKLLRKAGVEVEEDFMREECDALNPVFFHYITTKTPYVVMKYAMTADGRIATKTGASKWITGEASRMEVQRMRGRYMGIMTGIGTVLQDDPLLNVRVEGKRSPIRIICDSALRIPLDSRICRTAEKYPTIIACTRYGEEKKTELEMMGVEVIKIPGQQESPGSQEMPDTKVNLRSLMEILGVRNIDSILLEGGGRLNEGALRAGIVQEIRAFVAPKIFGGETARSPVAGTGAAFLSQAVALRYRGMQQFEEDLMLRYQVL